ncbi:MAG TPA: methyltransferase domain-containing protein, partial [Candidatus Dormibacteraeota bacterium]|nr:methyltransferase domain-containing protein [Candidatus Dormibacteraeota bacterium]
IAQTSAPEVIQAMLELLDPCPGQRVLEVGTGSGYSAALLAHLLGPQGRLVSLDVDPDLVERAQWLHRQAGHGQVEVHRADGFGGWPPAAPFEGIVAWATPHLLPRAWVEQTTAGGTIVTPVKIARVAAANAVLRCRPAGGEPGEATLHPGSLVEMAPRSSPPRGRRSATSTPSAPGTTASSPGSAATGCTGGPGKRWSRS